MTIAPAFAADSVGDFYRGKRITLVIGTGEGGGYDMTGRLAARYLGRYLPGNPVVVPQNMTGASSVIAAQYVYNVAAKDGTVLGLFQPYIVLQKLTDASARYQPEKFNWVGRVASNPTFGVIWHTSPVQTIEQAKARSIFLAGNSPSGLTATIPWALNRVAGTKFNVVMGYTSAASEGLAMERGEAQGVGNTSFDYLESRPDWLRDKKVKVLYTVALTRDPRAPDAPTVVELAQDVRDKVAMELLASVSDIGRSLVSPPGTPPERVAALRRAFDAMAKDEGFIRDAARQKIEVRTLPGEEVQKIVQRDMEVPAEAVARMSEVTKPPR